MLLSLLTEAFVDQKAFLSIRHAVFLFFSCYHFHCSSLHLQTLEGTLSTGYKTFLHLLKQNRMRRVCVVTYHLHTKMLNVMSRLTSFYAHWQQFAVHFFSAKEPLFTFSCALRLQTTITLIYIYSGSYFLNNLLVCLVWGSPYFCSPWPNSSQKPIDVLLVYHMTRIFGSSKSKKKKRVQMYIVKLNKIVPSACSSTI